MYFNCLVSLFCHRTICNWLEGDYRLIIHVYAQLLLAQESVFSNDVFLSKAKSDQGASRSHTGLFHAGMDILTSPFMAINIIFKKKRHICNIEVRNQAFGKKHSYMFTFTTKAILGRCRKRLSHCEGCNQHRENIGHNHFFAICSVLLCSLLFCSVLFCSVMNT